jgi:hypothetical protein
MGFMTGENSYLTVCAFILIVQSAGPYVERQLSRQRRDEVRTSDHEKGLWRSAVPRRFAARAKADIRRRYSVSVAGTAISKRLRDIRGARP